MELEGVMIFRVAVGRLISVQFKLVAVILSLLSLVVSAQSPGVEIIELETTTIQGNTELPKYMYVVPWRDTKSTRAQDRKLKLHNLYGDLFDPLLPEQISPTDSAQQRPEKSN